MGWVKGTVGNVAESRMMTRLDCRISMNLVTVHLSKILTVEMTTRSLDVVKSSAGVVISSKMVCAATTASRSASGAANAVL
jgi:hypothetical protein